MKRAFALLLLGLGACHPAPSAPAVVMPIEQPPPPEPVARSPELVPVARGPSFGLVRLPRGPVLLVDRGSRAIYETTANGSIRPFAPLGSWVAEHVPDYLRVAHVAGVWPGPMEVELHHDGRVDMYSEAVAIDIAGSSAHALGKKWVMKSAMPWKDGRVLAYSSPGGPGLAAHASLEVVSGPAADVVPTLPMDTLFDGVFVAYESGEVIAHASVSSPGDPGADTDFATVFVFADGATPVAHTMPSIVDAIIRGRVAAETLVQCDDAIRRYDPSGWVDVPLPVQKEKLRSLAVDDDGNAWLVLGEKLYRAAFPALAWVPVPLPAGFAPLEVAATTSQDVWIAGANGMVLHPGPAPTSEPIVLPDDQDGFVRLVTQGREPHPYFDGCQIPLVVLGDAADTKETDVLGAPIPHDLEGVLARGMLDGRSVYTYEPVIRDARVLAAVRRLVPKLRKKLPHVHLVCGRATDPQPVPRRTSGCAPRCD